MESNTGHHYNLSSSSNIIPLPSYISLIHISQSTYLTKYPYISLIYLTNYISHKLYIHISHIYYKPISHQVSPSIHTYYIYIYIYYKYYIPQNIYIFYHLHTSPEISNTHTKAILMEGTNLSYKSPSSRRHKPILQKPFSWEAILFITSL